MALRLLPLLLVRLLRLVRLGPLGRLRLRLLLSLHLVVSGHETRLQVLPQQRLLLGCHTSGQAGIGRKGRRCHLLPLLLLLVALLLAAILLPGRLWRRCRWLRARRCRPHSVPVTHRSRLWRWCCCACCR
jgi:hypothetical protein